jgi:hypothetical protein
MSAFSRTLRFAVPALAVLATAACSDHPRSASASGTTTPDITATAPNVNNPYATDPLDPNMNPHYLRGVH